MNNALRILLILFVLYILNKKFHFINLSKNKVMSANEFAAFYAELIKYIHKMEGGISDDTRDTASKFPLKGTFTINGKTYVNPHTNKGITYKNFVEFAKDLKYSPTNENFFNMPNDIWLSIFQKKYANKTKSLTDNPVLNMYIALWYWGGWYQGHVSPKQVTDALTMNVSNKEKLKALVELRKIYFDKVIKANPTNKVYERGWKNRADEYYNLFNKYL